MITQHPHRTRAGFTLIELLVVIGIMLLIMAIALPGVSQFLQGKIYNQAAQVVHSAFMRARSNAITQRELHYVLIYAIDGTLTLPRPSGGTKAMIGTANTLKVIDSQEKQGVAAKELTETGDTLVLPANTKIDTRYAASGLPGFFVEFNYDGSCSIQGKSPQDTVSTNLLITDIAATASKPLSSAFDLIIIGPEEDLPVSDTATFRRVYFDIVQGTGQLRFRVQPR